MHVDLLIWYGIAGALMVWALRDLWPALQRESAPRVVFGIVAGVHVVWAIVAIGSVFGWLPWNAPIVTSVLLFLPYVFSAQLIHWAGGPTNKEHLSRAYRRIQETVRRAKPGAQDVESARRQAKGLDRYRTTETSEWIGLVQAQVLDWAEYGAVGGPEAAERRGRMAELGDRLFTPKASGSESGDPERPRA
jgi:hypothetical protein